MNIKRYYYIDSLRVIAILMMFVFHVAMIFVAEWDWHIKNAEDSNMLLELNYWMSSFRMPVLFFVSGYISYILILRMNWKSFTLQRFNRLIIPTIIWTFILVAPQIYFERKLDGIEQSYFDFYKTFLQFEWWPEGNFHWLHLWFIPYLFFYNLISIPIILILERSKFLTEQLTYFFGNPFALIFFVFLAIIPNTFLSVHFPASYDLINDWARHSFFLPFIFAGILFFKFQEINEMLQSNRRLFLGFAFVSILLINGIRWNGLEPYGIWENWIEKPQTYIYNYLLNFNSWMWVFTCLGYGRKYLNRESFLLSYANTAVYPFYILHQTIIVIVGYYVVQTDDEVLLKFGFMIVVCFWICILIYHLFIKPFNLMRFLFGMKRLKKAKNSVEQA